MFVDLRELQDPKLSRNIGENWFGYLEETAQYDGQFESDAYAEISYFWFRKSNKVSVKI